MDDENWDDYVNRHKNLYHSFPYLLENYYSNFEKGITWWQSLYRMHLLRIKSI